MPIRDYIGPHNPFGGGGSRGQRFGRGMTEILGKVLGGAAGPAGSFAGGAAGRWLGQHIFPSGNPNALPGSPSPERISTALSDYIGVPNYARQGGAPPPGGMQLPGGMTRDASGGEYTYSYSNPAEVGPPAQSNPQGNPAARGGTSNSPTGGMAPRISPGNMPSSSTGGGLGYGWQSADPGMTMAALSSGLVNAGTIVPDLGVMWARKAVK